MRSAEWMAREEAAVRLSYRLACLFGCRPRDVMRELWLHPDLPPTLPCPRCGAGFYAECVCEATDV